MSSARKTLKVVDPDRPSSDDPMLFEPFFRTRSESVRIQRLQTQVERRKFGDAFTLVGCLRCESKQRPHWACGLCCVCYAWYRNVLRTAVRMRKDGELPA
jgi:hypothetical protein